MNCWRRKMYDLKTKFITNMISLGYLGYQAIDWNCEKWPQFLPLWSVNAIARPKINKIILPSVVLTGNHEREFKYSPHKSRWQEVYQNWKMYHEKLIYNQRKCISLLTGKKKFCLWINYSAQEHREQTKRQN